MSKRRVTVTEVNYYPPPTNFVGAGPGQGGTLLLVRREDLDKWKLDDPEFAKLVVDLWTAQHTHPQRRVFWLSPAFVVVGPQPDGLEPWDEVTLVVNETCHDTGPAERLLVSALTK